MSQHKIIVEKFGSSVLTNHQALDGIVEEIQATIEQGYKVVAVVSTLGNSANPMLSDVQHADATYKYATASYISAAELQAAAWLTLAAKAAGLTVSLLTPQQVGMLAMGDFLDGNPISINAEVIHQHFNDSDVIVIPGLYGTNMEGQVTLFGLGGCDLSALFIANALNADLCQLYKDVDGVYQENPTVCQQAKRYSVLSWKDALEIASQVLQTKALNFANEYKLVFGVKAVGKNYFTLVGGTKSSLSKRKTMTLKKVA